MEIELYYTPQTRSSRPRWLLEELGIPYTLQPVDLFGGESNPVHPLGSVPALRIDGKEIMLESCAICHWLADRFPDKQLAPAQDSPQRARYEQWMFFVPGTMEPPATNILMHSRILPEKHRVPDIVGYSEKDYRNVLHMLAKELDHDGYLLGENFSCADILVGTTLTFLPEQFESLPALQNYVERVTARPAYQRAMQAA
jgi:glutathione S-transferase